jgi:hypothetical protein
MKYNGIIAFDRELTFSQSQQLQQFLREKHACLEICQNGRGLQWDNKNISTDLAIILADIMERFWMPWKLNATGVITVGEKKNEAKYDIVVVAKIVWIYDGKVRRVKPSGIRT